MKKSIKCVIALILMAAMLTAPAAMADLQRGSRGEEVAALQQMLFETGWLFELPDGIFGKNTEAAVRQFEAYANLPVDGIADEVMIRELGTSLDALNEELGVDIDDSGAADAAECCVQWSDASGSSHTEYCDAHNLLHAETWQMLQSGSLEQAQYASGLWYEEVSRLYDQWASLLPQEEQGGVLANRATFLASVEAQRVASNFGKQTEDAKIKTEVGICQNLRSQAAWLCGLIWQHENAGTDGESRAVVLNSSVIIDGDTIYYSGSIAGQGEGVYSMNLDGSDLRLISDIQAMLKAVSDGNLLVWHYDSDGYAAMEVLRSDGTLETVGYSNCYAMAHGGRFYFGGSSVADDGSDHNWILSSDPEYHDDYYPICIADGYLYYMDTLESGLMLGATANLPGGAVLSRLNLESGGIELLSGDGTRFLGIEDGTVYYVRENFNYYDENGGVFMVEVDEGLYAMNLSTLEELRLADLSDGEKFFDTYRMVDDGVIFADRFDYLSNPDGSCSIVRLQTDGNMLEPILFSERHTVTGVCAADGVYYGVSTTSGENANGYYTIETIVRADAVTGRVAETELPDDESMFYTESLPQVAVVDGRLYCYVLNETDYSESLKVMNPDGSGVRTIVRSDPM